MTLVDDLVTIVNSHLHGALPGRRLVGRNVRAPAGAGSRNPTVYGPHMPIAAEAATRSKL